MISEKTFWFWVALLWVLFALGVYEAEPQDTPLSDVGTLHRISVEGCGDGSYAVRSEEMGCTLIYKSVDLNGGRVFIRPLNLDKDGDCDCPEEDL